MSYWPSFCYQGVFYHLDHLNAFDLRVVQPESNGKPEKEYWLRVKFSHHLYTDEKKGIKELIVRNSTGRDPRNICLSRYHSSFMAVQMVKGLGTLHKNCFAEKNNNHFVFNLYETSSVLQKRIEKNALKVVFRIRAYNKNPEWMELFVESAHTVPEGRHGRRPSGKISFFTLLAKKAEVIL